MSQLYPLLLEPTLSPRLWGGEKLEPFLNLKHDANANDPLGESWQVYSENRILNGALAGQTLADVAEVYGEALLGTLSLQRYGKKVPLLAKFIDAADRLSIQVHPNDSYARTFEAQTGHLGKAEAWYVLEAEANSSIIWGFKDELGQADLRVAIEEERLQPHLNIVPVKAGEVIYNPPGTVHAIGAGIFLFEIQQSSDLTYRLYDYGRRDAAGNLRDLHVDKALAVADLTPGERAKWMPKALSDTKDELISTEHFAMERWRVLEGQQETTQKTSFEILTLLEGTLKLKSGDEVLELTRGMSVVLPAALGTYELEPKSSLESVLLRCYIPKAGARG